MNRASVGNDGWSLVSLAGTMAVLWGSMSAAQQPATEVAPPAKQSSRPKVEQVIVVFKTHFDIGYTQLAREVVERYRTTMIDKALAVCDASEKLPPEHRFVWTIPGWPMQQILWPGQTPQRRVRVEKAVRDGRLVWHALAGTTHTESMGLEDIVRSLEFSSRLARQFGQPLPRDAKMTDVPCHSRVLPTVLRRAGVDFLHLGCNSASGSPDIPQLFWWEGPDGSRLLTMYTAEGYGTDLIPPADWKHKTWLALIHTGDNHGPPEPGEVHQLLQRAKKELPGVKIKMGRLSDFGDAILAEEKARPTLPVVRKDMPDTWIHGLLSMPEQAALARQTRPMMTALESLDTLRGAWGGKVTKEATLRDTLAAAYEGSFLYSEHTWGASSREYSPRLYGEAWKKAHEAGKYKYAEESWREHAAYIEDAAKRVGMPLADTLDQLARSVDAEGPRIVVYNPLPWRRDTALVRMESLRDRTFRWVDSAHRATDAPEAEQIAIGLLLVRNLPPLGYVTLVPQTQSGVVPEAAPPGSNVIETPFFRLEADCKRGVVTSLVDKRRGRELLDKTSDFALGETLYERYDKKDHLRFLEDYCKKPLPGWAEEFGRANLPPASERKYLSSRGEVLDSSELSFRQWGGGCVLVRRIPTDGAATVRMVMILHRSLPYIEMQYSVSEFPSDPWPQALWAPLPFAIDEPKYRLGRLGSIIDPATDIVPGANVEMFAVDSGLTITGRDGQGVGLCPIGTPLVSIGRPGGFRFSKQFGQRKPTVFVNLYNNIWGTNFHQWAGGSWTMKIRIWSVAGKGPEADLITPGWEARCDAFGAYSDLRPGRLPPTQPGLELSRKGVLVTALGANGNGPGTLLRLWEQSGQDGVCRVRLPESMRVKKARLVDLRGQSLPGALACRDGWLDVPLVHFAPTSVVLEDAK